MSQYPASPQHSGPDPSSQSTGAPGLAIAALVCGIVGLCFAPVGIAALVMGIIFLSNTSDNKAGRGMALAGTILGAVGLVFSVIALLIAILLPALGAARTTARNMQNSTQLRGIHQAMIVYSNSNRNFFPGLDSQGNIVADGAATGNSGDGNTPQARMWMLLDGNFITPEFAISPKEIDPIVPYNFAGPVTEDNYSYAQLAFDSNSAGRLREMAQTLNNQAVVMADRNIGTNATTAVDSIDTQSPGTWNGSIAWNDNAVMYADTHIQVTQYDNGQLVNNDNLFEDDGTNGYDAILIWD